MKQGKVIFSFSAVMLPTDNYPYGYCTTIKFEFKTNKNHFLYGSRFGTRAVAEWLNRHHNGKNGIKELGYTYGMTQN